MSDYPPNRQTFNLESSSTTFDTTQIYFLTTCQPYMSNCDSPPFRPGSPRSTVSSSGIYTPQNLYQNSADPSVTWLVQKYGGTGVGKFAVKIAEDIIP